MKVRNRKNNKNIWEPQDKDSQMLDFLCLPRVIFCRLCTIADCRDHQPMAHNLECDKSTKQYSASAQDIMLVGLDFPSS